MKKQTKFEEFLDYASKKNKHSIDQNIADILIRHGFNISNMNTQDRFYQAEALYMSIKEK